MKKLARIASIIILIVSLFLLFDKLFTPQPIQIVLESGQEVTTQTADYFSLTETILLIVCAFLIGTTVMYLFYTTENNTEKSELKVAAVDVKSTFSLPNYSQILPLLKDDEKKVIQALQEEKGVMLQNRLVLRLNISKVKVTRLLDHLEQKNLIVKERHGLTNNIKLKKEL